MIGYIRGKVSHIFQDYILVDYQGLGFKLYGPLNSVKLNEEYLFYTHMQVREDDISLFGFLDQHQYQLFNKLISVKGLGSKTASQILNKVKIEDLVRAIDSSDTAFIKTLPGIGNKMASQIILDLKGKLIEVVNNEVNTDLERMKNVAEALKSLGFKINEINAVLKTFDKVDLSDEALLKQALKKLQNK